jgi:hypothetical protein
VRRAQVDGVVEVVDENGMDAGQQPLEERWAEGE